MAEAAGSEFEQFGATRWLGRVEALISRIESAEKPAESPFRLSAREVEVLRLVAAGMTDAQVADELHVSYRTVTTHLTSIFNKLGVNSRVSATRIAVQHGLV